MNYIEITVTILPYNDIISEILIAELSDAGCDSFSEITNGFQAYIPQDMYNFETINSLLRNSNYAETINYETKVIEAQNWNAVWESNFEPVIIDNRCTIRAPFHTNLPKTALEIIIEPKMSFGTGHHETTYLMTTAILDKDVNNLNVLDMGCGTGILAIVAAMKGAKHVDAIDNDEWATNNAIENVIKNDTRDQITVITGDASLLTGYPQYNLILANINRNILLNDMPQYIKSLLPKGTLLMSGIYIEDIPLIKEAATQLSLQFIEQKSKNKWAMVEFEKI